jgi:hypothetical protein
MSGQQTSNGGGGVVIVVNENERCVPDPQRSGTQSEKGPR